MELTTCQQKAFEEITTFINQPNLGNREFLYTLSGFAGTGKSTLVNYILNKVNKTCVVSAPTHKAKKIISDFTNKRGETIQSLLGLRPNTEIDNFDPNKPVFDMRAEERLKNYKLAVIDECSMINKELFELIDKKAKQHKTIVLFVGDDYQLPPIGEDISFTFKLNNISYLKTIVRQSTENPNKPLLNLARKDIEIFLNDRLNSYFTENYLNRVVQDVNGKDGFSLLNRSVFYSKLLEFYYDTEANHNPDFIKTICYTNKTVGKINNYIRNKVNYSEEKISPGDVLMGYRTIARDVGKGAFETIIENSKDYLVENADISEQNIVGTMLKGYITKFKDISKPVFILHKDSYQDYIAEYENRLQKAKMFRAWRAFYNFKDRIVIPENLFNKGKFVVGKDIDYGYAITVHKSQGSTYNNVGIILNDIKRASNTLESKKLLYVALSRAKNFNLIYNG